jgi:hypothetical protein
VAGWTPDWNLPDIRDGYGAPRLERKTKDKASRVGSASSISMLDEPGTESGVAPFGAKPKGLETRSREFDSRLLLSKLRLPNTSSLQR